LCGIAALAQEIHRANIKRDSDWLIASVHDENAPRPKPWHIPRLKEGELVLVDKWGGARRLNPALIDMAALQDRAQQGEREGIVSLTEARAYMQFKRDSKAEYRRTRTAERNQRWEERHAAYETLKEDRANKRELAAFGAGFGEGIAAPLQEAVPGAALQVVDALGVVMGLADFVLGFLGLDSPPPAPDPFTQREMAREREEAMARSARNLTNQTPLEARDLQTLTRDERLLLRERGDDYLRELVAQEERQRRRERERER